jgi:ATP-dependent protease ClpP protease subunit
MNGFQPFDHGDIELFYDKGIAIPSRTLYIGSESTTKDEEEIGVDFKLAERAIKGLHVLNSLGQEPITIQMNNIGGDEYHGLAIYDAIKQSVAPTIIIVYGHAVSMGSVILQAANKRILSANATVMVHMGDLNLNFDQRDTEANLKEVLRFNEIINEIYLHRIREKNPRYSTNQLKELLSTDRYLNPREAIELGLADERI